MCLDLLCVFLAVVWRCHIYIFAKINRIFRISHNQLLVEFNIKNLNKLKSLRTFYEVRSQGFRVSLSFVPKHNLTRWARKFTILINIMMKSMNTGKRRKWWTLEGFSNWSLSNVGMLCCLRIWLSWCRRHI